MTDLLQPQAPLSWRDHLLAWWARCTPGRLAAAIVVAALAVVGAWLLLRPVAAPAPLVLPRADGNDVGGAGASRGTTRAGASPSTPGSAGQARSSSTAQGNPEGAVFVTVHAAGAVNRPGVYALSDGARVADVVTAAGGLATDADMDRINLAARVSDGERVYAPRKGEENPPTPVGGNGTGTTKPGAATAGPIDLNTATAEQLDTLPGVGPSTSAAIVSYRERNGRFRAVDELLEVPGIGPAKLETLRPLVRT